MHEINDNGKSFKVERVLNARGRKRLGLLGMRERVEMVGGQFGIESIPGRGTTITAQLPPGKTNGEITGKGPVKTNLKNLKVV